VNLDAIHRRISAAGGDPGAVTVVAVTKGLGADAVTAALAAGLVAIGESYAQELVTKAAAVGEPGPEWHFIGRLQRNKVRGLAGLVSLWQSVDRPALAEAIARHAPAAAVLVQVDVTGEPQKGGCPPGDVAALVATCGGLGLDVRGLMAIGPLGPAEDARPGFRRVRELADELGLAERSMGMSADLEVAIEEGSTMVRVGTALFGPRP
jgi:pyridoxal phosphate enzyme (YggS family)